MSKVCENEQVITQRIQGMGQYKIVRMQEVIKVDEIRKVVWGQVIQSYCIQVGVFDVLKEIGDKNRCIRKIILVFYLKKAN